MAIDRLRILINIDFPVEDRDREPSMSTRSKKIEPLDRPRLIKIDRLYMKSFKWRVGKVIEPSDLDKFFNRILP